MPTYFDSSVLLSILKNDSRATEGASLWVQHQNRVGSILLKAECLIVLRRAAFQFEKKLPAGWLREREDKLQTYLEEMELKLIDDPVIDIIKNEKKLSSLKTLDALHLASALFFKKAFPESFYLCTFDKQMAEIANKIGFTIVGIV